MKKILLFCAMALCCSGLFAKQHFEVYRSEKLREKGYTFEKYMNHLIEKGYTIQHFVTYFDVNIQGYMYYILYEDNGLE